MECRNVLDLDDRDDFRKWLEENHDTEKECWLSLKIGKPQDDGQFYYLDAVEEALCFGWIDSTLKIIDGKTVRRFSPRTKKGSWTELNKERVRRLEKLGLMTDAGRAVLPDMNVRHYRFDDEFLEILKKNRIGKKFREFPPLYQRVRSSSIMRTKVTTPEKFENAVANFVVKTKNGEMYGEWNDYGRLIDY